MNDFSILQIDDNELDRERLRKSLKKLAFDGPLHEAIDGQEALQILSGDTYIKVETPLLIFLDLNMPRLSGYEFLNAVRANPIRAKNAHIVVLTTSEDPRDRKRTEGHRLSGYLIKPATPEKIKNLMDGIFQGGENK